MAGIGAQVAAALAAAHAEGIVHRDVTPSNVLVTHNGTAKLADFGISRAVGEGTFTDGGVIAGTPAFLAPEVAGGADAVFASDVFSLGATLYAAVEGTPPFERDENPYALLQRVARGEIRPPRQAGLLADVLNRMLRPDPVERPGMDEVGEALTAVAAGKPVPPPRDPTLLLPTRRGPSRRLLVAGVSAVALVAAGVLIGSVINGADRPASAGAAPATTAQVPPSRATPPNPAQPSVPPSRATPSRATPPNPAQSSGASAGTSTAAAPVCTASYRVTNAWPDGYQVEVTVRNEDGRGVTGWAVSWQLPPTHTIVNLWGGIPTRAGSTVTVTDAGYNAVLAANGTTSFGFIASTSGDGPAQPDLSCSRS
ncbi:cellulose binding domain-containing protein [Amycolatopsis acidiphila]|nr:cellulose binding domain-containing protein [Amycolatopsis acidiphila]GHG78547.1 hypothetical protein GCM10017788_45870 [Amycolatopsis acidiphila]